MKTILIILTLLVVVSCGRKIVPEKTEVHDTLQVIKKVRLRDTIFITVPANVHANIPLQKMGNTHIDKSNKQAQLIIDTRGDTVYINCHCDTMAIKARLRDSIIHSFKTKTTVKTQYIKQKYTPWYIKALAWFGGIAFLIFGGAIVKKFRL